MFIPFESTLEEMYETITEKLFPFISFNVVDANEKVVASMTIPWARFRPVEDREDLWEVRSNDSEAMKHTLYLSKELLSRYIFTRQESQVYYVFTYYTGVK